MSATTEEAESRQSEYTWDGRIQPYRPATDWKAHLAAHVPLDTGAADDVDPITFEVIRHRLWTINTAHGETVTRVSGSPVFATLDFNMCILSTDGEIVLNAPYLQYLDAGAPLGVRFISERYSENPGIDDGDIFITNDPWIAAVHQMDVVVLCPVFVEGRLFAWVSNAGHQYDLGGVEPGGWPQNAPDVYHDPVVMTPFKIVEKGVLRNDLDLMYLRHSRLPDLVALDVRAQLAGARFARDELVALCAQHGRGTVKGVMNRIIENAQRSFQDRLLKIPDGTWSEVRYFDERLPGDRAIYRMQVNVTKTGDRLRIDNTGTQAQEQGPIGFTFAAFSGSVTACISPQMLYDQLFAIAGADRQIDYDPTPGLLTCVNYPAAVSGATMNILCHIHAIMTCLGRMLGCDDELVKDVIAPHAEWPLVVLSGTDDRGKYFGTAILDAYALGSGARSFGDGVDTGGPIWSPLSYLLNVESVEQWYPIVFLFRRELTDSGGAGRWRGGVGMTTAFTPYRAESITLVTNTGGLGISTYGAEGLAGGYPSPTARYQLLRGTDVSEQFGNERIPADLDALAADERLLLRSKSNGTALTDGDVFETTFCGGGGYGDPITREPERVVRDVALGRVSRETAAEVYGVALDAEGALDASGTDGRRRDVRRQRGNWPAAASGGETGGASISPQARAGARPINGNLLAAQSGGNRILACRSCGAELCDYHANYKEALLMDASPVTAIPLVLDPSRFHDDVMVFRRYCCPSCHVLLTTEVVRATEPILQEMTLY